MEQMFNFLDRLITAEKELSRLNTLIGELKKRVETEEIEQTRSDISYNVGYRGKKVSGSVDCSSIRSLFGWAVTPEAQALVDEIKKEDLDDEHTL